MATPQLYYKNGNSWQSAMLNSYPVGAIYSSTSSTNPGSIFGGGWVEITGAVLRGNQQAGVYSDSDTHTLSTNEMPTHRHISNNYVSGDYWLGYNSYGDSTTYAGVAYSNISNQYSIKVSPKITTAKLSENRGGGASSYKQAACLQCLYVEKNFINLDVM